MDDGTSDGSDTAELTRLQAYDTGANETPGVTQPAPTPRAGEKETVGMNDINNVASPAAGAATPAVRDPLEDIMNANGPGTWTPFFNPMNGFGLGTAGSPGPQVPQGNFGKNQQQYSYGYNGSYGSPSNNGTPANPDRSPYSASMQAPPQPQKPTPAPAAPTPGSPSTPATKPPGGYDYQYLAGLGGFFAAIPPTFASGQAFDSFLGLIESAVGGTLRTAGFRPDARGPVFGHDEEFEGGQKLGKGAVFTAGIVTAAAGVAGLTAVAPPLGAALAIAGGGSLGVGGVVSGRALLEIGGYTVLAGAGVYVAAMPAAI